MFGGPRHGTRTYQIDEYEAARERALRPLRLHQTDEVGRVRDAGWPCDRELGVGVAQGAPGLPAG